MSVYTALDDGEIAALLDGYAVGALRCATPIAEGIENTNYFVDTTEGRFVLTVFERVRAEDLPFFLAFMRHLAARGVPCPDVVPRRDGGWLFRVRGKSGCLLTRLPGRTCARLDAAQLHAAGAMLARMHLAAADFDRTRPNPNGAAWLRETHEAVRNTTARRWGAEAARLLADEVARQLDRDWAHGLARAVIHGDLFPDNLLFEGSQLSGVIDFYYAHTNALVFDLAIAVNALAMDPARPGAGDAPRVRALLAGYRRVRPLPSAERDALGDALRAAALRFWLSRLVDAIRPRAGALTTIKDPDEYRRKLAWWRSEDGARLWTEALG